MATIKMSSLSGREPHVEARHEWPDGAFLQGGSKGLVITRTPGKPSYYTAFVEVFINSGDAEGFYRGEGADVAAAEDAAWAKYQKANSCPGHEWESRGYTNGGGFCIHCKKFGSKVFTGEQLGQFCAECGEGTTYSQAKDIDGSEYWYCETHYQVAALRRYIHIREKKESGPITDSEQSEIIRQESLWEMMHGDRSNNLSALRLLLESFGS